jgi:transposase-like protein
VPNAFYNSDSDEENAGEDRKCKRRGGAEHRRSYTLKFKLECVAVYEENRLLYKNVRDITATAFNIPASLLSKWAKHKQQYMEMLKRLSKEAKATSKRQQSQISSAHL